MTTPGNEFADQPGDGKKTITRERILHFLGDKDFRLKIEHVVEPILASRLASLHDEIEHLTGRIEALEHEKLSAPAQSDGRRDPDYSLVEFRRGNLEAAEECELTIEPGSDT